MACIEPKTSVLRSLKHQRLPWKIIMGEFIDNAFDASASRITFTFDKKRLVIEDDGIGCEDVLKMITLGDRENHKDTRLGCYGVGAKDAALSAADGLSIISVHRGMRRFVTVNWKELERSGEWIIDDPTECHTADHSGTRIELGPLRNEHKPDIESLVKSLSLQYTPAIRQGRQIAIAFGTKKPPITVPEFRLPPLEHQLTADLNVDGKLARVTVGIVPEGSTCQLSGMTLSYGYRVIKSDTRIGLGGDPTPSLVGWCELGSGWELTKNKDNISSNCDALSDAIYAACKETIQKAAATARNVLFDGVASQVNAALEKIAGEHIHRAKAKRGKGDKTGSVKPRQTARRHTQAAIIQPGDTFPIRQGKSSAIKVAFEAMGEDGSACRYQDGVAYLNKDNQIIKSQMHDESALAIHAIYAVSTYMATEEEGPQMELFYKHDADTVFKRMSLIAGMLMSGLKQPQMEVTQTSAA